MNEIMDAVHARYLQRYSPSSVPPDARLMSLAAGGGSALSSDARSAALHAKYITIVLHLGFFDRRSAPQAPQ